MDISLIGEQIGHYRVDALLGHGGMGAVYRAFDRNLARQVALKVMHGHLADEAQFKQRFMQEAQAVARLDHPSIVNIHDFGQDGDLLYMVMPFLEGGTLAAYISELKRQEKSASLHEILFLLSQVADALGYAHAQGVLHRDVKPDNIMIKQLLRPERADEPPLRAVVTDFGLAKLLEGGMHTATGTILGTMNYISPEQCKREAPSNRSDIYSLGVMLYHLSTGQLPHEINSPTDAIIKHISELPPLPTDVRPDLPPPLEVVINKAMAKDPDDRYESAEDMASMMRRIRAMLTSEPSINVAPDTVVLTVTEQLETGTFDTQDMPTRPPQQPLAARETQPQAPSPAKIKLVLRPKDLNVSPGGKVSAGINVLNTGGTAASVKLQIDDLPRAWIKTRQDTINLPPGSQQTIPIIISPPLDTSATAGQHRFRVRALSSVDQVEMAAVTGRVQISVFERFASELRPSTVKNGETAQILVRNDSNVVTNFQVGGRRPK